MKTRNTICLFVLALILAGINHVRAGEYCFRPITYYFKKDGAAAKYGWTAYYQGEPPLVQNWYRERVTTTDWEEINNYEDANILLKTSRRNRIVL